MRQNRKPSILDALPPSADYPWRATGARIEAYNELSPDVPPDDQPDEWQLVAVAASPDVAEVIAAVINAAFRNGVE
jgi:hypothetical protein